MAIQIWKKRPVAIEAVLWTGENHHEMISFLEGQSFEGENLPKKGKNFYIDHKRIKGGLMIKTLESPHEATIGDYIIKGVAGEFYPCKPKIFKDTYEYVKDLQ